MRMSVSLGVAAACLSALAFTAPALAGPDEKAGDQAEDGPDPRIGKEVDRICFNSTINGWKGVKGEDDVVLLQRGANDWYRAELTGACDYRLFRSAQAIGIESRPSGGCVTRGDVIIVRDGPGFARRCFITDLYEWDGDAEAPSDDDEEGSEQDS